MCERGWLCQRTCNWMVTLERRNKLFAIAEVEITIGHIIYEGGDMSRNLHLIDFFVSKKPINCNIVSSPQTLFTRISTSDIVDSVFSVIKHIHKKENECDCELKYGKVDDLFNWLIGFYSINISLCNLAKYTNVFFFFGYFLTFHNFWWECVVRSLLLAKE